MKSFSLYVELTIAAHTKAGMRQAAAIRLRNDRQMVSWMKENTNPIVGSTKWSWLFAVEPET